MASSPTPGLEKERVELQQGEELVPPALESSERGAHSGQDRPEGSVDEDRIEGKVVLGSESLDDMYGLTTDPDQPVIGPYSVPESSIGGQGEVPIIQGQPVSEEELSELYGLTTDPDQPRQGPHSVIEPAPVGEREKPQIQVSEKLARALEDVLPGSPRVLTTGSARIQAELRSLDGAPSHIPGYEYRVEDRESGGLRVSAVPAGFRRIVKTDEVDLIRNNLEAKAAAGDLTPERVSTSAPEVKEAILGRHGRDLAVTECVFLARTGSSLNRQFNEIQKHAEALFEQGAPPLRVKLNAPALDVDPRDRAEVNKQLLAALDGYKRLQGIVEAVRDAHGPEASKAKVIEIVTANTEVREFVKSALKAEKQRDKLTAHLEACLSAAYFQADAREAGSLPKPISMSVGLEYQRMLLKEIRPELVERWGRALVDAVLPLENIRPVSSGLKIHDPRSRGTDSAAEERAPEKRRSVQINSVADVEDPAMMHKILGHAVSQLKVTNPADRKVLDVNVINDPRVLAALKKEMAHWTELMINHGGKPSDIGATININVKPPEPAPVQEKPPVSGWRKWVGRLTFGLLGG